MNNIEEKVSNHLKKVRNFNLEKLKEHIDTAYAIWLERNNYVWNLDLDLITSNGFQVVKPVKIKDRINIALEKIIK